jgi:hypothetical protein
MSHTVTLTACLQSQATLRGLPAPPSRIADVTGHTEWRKPCQLRTEAVVALSGHQDTREAGGGLPLACQPRRC